MKTKLINIYEFEELSEKAKTKAIELASNYLVPSNWWEYIYDDAELIGIKIIDFDIWNDNYCNIELLEGETANSVADKIFHNHGKSCGTYKVASDFLNNQDENEFLNALSREYSSMLKYEEEYVHSEENITEMIFENNYMFLEDGSLS